MTRRSKRELERTLEDLTDGGDDGDTLEVVIRRDRVDEDCEVVERNETVAEMRRVSHSRY